MTSKDKKEKKEKDTSKLFYATTKDLELIFTSEGTKSEKTISIFRPRVPKKFFLVGDYCQVKIISFLK
jgi:hypothetical protein